MSSHSESELGETRCVDPGYPEPAAEVSEARSKRVEDSQVADLSVTKLAMSVADSALRVPSLRVAVPLVGPIVSQEQVLWIDAASVVNAFDRIESAAVMADHQPIRHGSDVHRPTHSVSDTGPSVAGADGPVPLMIYGSFPQPAAKLVHLDSLEQSSLYVFSRRHALTLSFGLNMIAEAV